MDERSELEKRLDSFAWVLVVVTLVTTLMPTSPALVPARHAVFIALEAGTLALFGARGHVIRSVIWLVFLAYDLSYFF